MRATVDIFVLPLGTSELLAALPSACRCAPDTSDAAIIEAMTRLGEIGDPVNLHRWIVERHEGFTGGARATLRQVPIWQDGPAPSGPTAPAPAPEPGPAAGDETHVHRHVGASVFDAPRAACGAPIGVPFVGVAPGRDSVTVNRDLVTCPKCWRS